MSPTLLMVRHGQSVSNAEGQFTGWTDVALTGEGERQARNAGELVRDAGVLPDVVHTSVLRRTIRTAEIMLDVLDRSWLPVHRSWRLNERHYGALTGRSKSAVHAEVGAELFGTWRRSLLQRPPAMEPQPLAALRADPRYAQLPAGMVPATESLADVLARVLPYWVDAIAPDVRAGRIPLVVAHGNSLRALIMHLDGLTAEQVEQLNVPTGIPLRYDLDEQLIPHRRGGRYLDPDSAARAARAVAGEGT
jgi:2,3-bisphosphoglycerate-dependent phosphoglycerate mutase